MGLRACGFVKPHCCSCPLLSQARLSSAALHVVSSGSAMPVIDLARPMSRQLLDECTGVDLVVRTRAGGVAVGSSRRAVAELTQLGLRGEVVTPND